MAPSSPSPPEPRAPRVEIIEGGADGRSCAGSTSTASARPSATGCEDHFEFHPLDYEDLPSRNQRPKVDEYDDYLFVVLQFPRYDKQLGRLSAAELDVFLGPDYVLTVPNQPLRSLDYLFERCQADEELRDQLFGKGAGYLLYRIVDDAVDAVVPDAAQDRQQARAAGGRHLRGALQRGRPRHLQRQAGDHQLPQRRAPDAPRARRPRAHDQALRRPRTSTIYFDDINDASERVWDMLENFKEVVEALESTNESVLSHELNKVLRVLTAFSVMMLPLTLIASIFGMNVHVPRPGRRRAASGSSSA